MIHRDFFEELFVLELANNHWGSVERGLKIIADFSKIVRFNNVRATIKLQFRDVDNFIHKDFRGRDASRYIERTRDTQLSSDELAAMADASRKAGSFPSAGPFDETSVDFCKEPDLPLI